MTDIIDGRDVVAPLREIQEVKNALKTYELYPQLDAFSLDDLLKAHGVMMAALTNDVGRFRRGGVGVFSGADVVHMAPPADRVPHLMADLFDWLRCADDHLLIRSCVFHYEFEFIHPFSDGNGRTGRLWQSLIPGKLNPMFEFLPIENMVYSNQEAYYKAIAQSTALGDSAPFIEFMLGEILKTLKEHSREPEYVGINVGINLDEAERRALALIAENNRITGSELAACLSISQRQAERLISSLKGKGALKRVGSNKSGSWEICC